MVPDARQLVEQLLGSTVVTLAEHEPNEVLAIRGADVIVGTKKSPEGAGVPLRIIQQGLDILFSEGEVRIEPATFGKVRRSSFVGAALGTLPGVEWTDPPVWVRLTANAASAVRSPGDGSSYPLPEVAAAVDAAGLPIALAAIRERFAGLEVEPMDHNNPGFDVRVRDEKGAVIAYVEVKSTASCLPGFFVSETERKFAEDHADRYYFLVVTGVRTDGRCDGNPHWHHGSLDHEDIELEPRQYRGRLLT